MDRPYLLSNFYCFTPIALPEAAAAEIRARGQSLDLMGLMIVAAEGLNGTFVTRDESDRERVKDWFTAHFSVPRDRYKDAVTSRRPFRHGWQVKVRSEIVTLHAPDLIPLSQDPTRLRPEQWNAWLKGDRPFTLIDARNDYEYRIGHFRGALDPDTKQFAEFPDAVELKLKADKATPLLIYCTGGIRCEKAALELKRRGYNEVYQLDGGILRYLEQYPDDQFEGECFVFDDRVAVDQHLKPTTRYKLCPHCGDPADQTIQCVMCGKTTMVCPTCHTDEMLGVTCAKNCAHHRRLRPWRTAASKAPGTCATR